MTAKARSERGLDTHFESRLSRRRIKIIPTQRAKVLAIADNESQIRYDDALRVVWDPCHIRVASSATGVLPRRVTKLALQRCFAEQEFFSEIICATRWPRLVIRVGGSFLSTRYIYINDQRSAIN